VSAGFGFAAFDGASATAGGLASIEGQPSFRFAGHDALDPAITWHTNLAILPPKGAPSQSSTGGLRMDFPCRVSARDLALEFGASWQSDPQGAVRLLSAILARTERVMERQYALPAGGTGSFSERLAVKLLAPDPAQGLSITQLRGAREILLGAYRVHQRCPEYARDRGVPMTFRFDRLAHAERLMNLPAAMGGLNRWEGGLPSGHDEMMELAEQIAPHRMGLCKAAVSDVPVQYKALLGLAGTQSAEMWLTLQEACHMTRLGRVRLLDLYVSTDQAASGVSAPLPPWGLIAHASVSAGLLAEAHWQALGGTHSVSAGAQSIRVPDLRSICVRAWDRIACIEAAIRFMQAGVRISGYGSGAVFVWLRSSRDARTAVQVVRDMAMAPAHTPTDILSALQPIEAEQESVPHA
jgi:hypothetical protein